MNQVTKIRIPKICQNICEKYGLPTVLAKYPVVIDKLQYGLTPIAVESKCHIIRCLALGANLDEGMTALAIVFRIQHNPSSRFVDPTIVTCKFKMQLMLTLPASIQACASYFLL